MKYTVEISAENWKDLKNYLDLITGDVVSHYFEDDEIPVKFTLPWAEVEAEVKEATAATFGEMLYKYTYWDKCAEELKALHS